jgi:hypothetical protein
MPQYRHYLLDGAGNITSAQWLAASDDDDAIAQVEARKLSCACEIWDRKRLVARIEATSAQV